MEQGRRWVGALEDSDIQEGGLDLAALPPQQWKGEVGDVVGTVQCRV